MKLLGSVSRCDVTFETYISTYLHMNIPTKHFPPLFLPIKPVYMSSPRIAVVFPTLKSHFAHTENLLLVKATLFTRNIAKWPGFNLPCSIELSSTPFKQSKTLLYDIYIYTVYYNTLFLCGGVMFVKRRFAVGETSPWPAARINPMV